MANRIEGQTWISREEPNTLKYYARGKEYWAVSATTYTAAEAIAKGTIVVPDTGTTGTLERVRRAVWPKDTDSVLGIALNTAAPNGSIRILGYGYIKLTAAELAAIFVTKSDLVATAALTAGNYYTAFGNTTLDNAVGAGNGWADAASSKNGQGAPVYWFSGRTLKTSGGYSWADSASYQGKLTFATPTGYKPTGAEIPWGDDALNLSYKQLPVIGNVINYTYDGSYNLTELTLHVNFAKFAKKIQFEYPSQGLKQFTAPTVVTDVLRHGLFTDDAIRQPHVEISMWGYSDSTLESESAGQTTRVWPGYDSFLTDKRTEVEIQSDSSFYYKILGEVSYTL